MSEKQELLELMEERDRRLARRSFYSMFPDEDSVWGGPRTSMFERGGIIHARCNYPGALEFFEACGKYREVGAMAANRVGKTAMGAYQTAVWTTGLYPHWWQGRRYPGPIDMWVVGQTNETTRDILQRKLFGEVILLPGGSRKGLSGTGVVPGDMIVNPPAWKAGVTDLVDSVNIRHASGELSRIGLKSYQQGRLAFEGTERHAVWLDEEVPRDIYGECIIRTMTVKGGIVMLTFTPLLGLTETALLFMPGSEN